MEVVRHKIARIGCCDPRVEKSDVFYFGSVGAAVINEVIENMGPVLEVIEELQLVGHRDCRASRVRVGLPFAGELGISEAAKGESETRRFLAENARKLRAHPMIQAFIKRGGKVVVGIDHLPGIRFDLV